MVADRESRIVDFHSLPGVALSAFMLHLSIAWR